MWEMVGLISYLLIGFWFTRVAANMGAMKALFVNRLGDYGQVIGLVVAIAVFSDLSLGTIFSLAAYINGDLLFIFCICFILAASAKSALVGLHPWIFEAMEGSISAKYGTTENYIYQPNSLELPRVFD